VRGLALSRDDLVRRAVIMALMCQGEVQFEAIELAYMIKFRLYFSAELDALEELAQMGIVEIEAGALRVTSTGWFFIRAIAMLFDRYLQVDRNRVRFSRII
jgi:oxygen-independent coproporphyrinogen-3 oxidase